MFDNLRADFAAAAGDRTLEKGMLRILMRLETPADGSRVASSMKRTSTPGNEPAGQVNLPPEVLQDATLKLAAYLGPIARVIVTRAAVNVPDTNTFYERLLNAVQDPKDCHALRRDFGIAPD